ncbi:MULTISPECIES: hypothetical protein [unclassified Rhizobium]|uniref:hypothetical protein n=1 Tax=unclassified Rhizobium TaxID=2613769 RepID=UPI0006F74633|nr:MULTISPECIES: hypothetical protein [unclassified Rhizobium]KQV33140.1 hypothetical protein ASC86_18445 [Rhizobium sp. Root1212]KRD21600.1 hypothetical protein ASE37_18945 [Rhizobium sp. Root268]
MDEETDGRLAAMELAILSVVMALEDMPETAIKYRLGVARSRMAAKDPESVRTISALETFDRLFPITHDRDGNEVSRY